MQCNVFRMMTLEQSDALFHPCGSTVDAPKQKQLHKTVLMFSVTAFILCASDNNRGLQKW